MSNTDSPLDGLRSELAKVLHLNGCQQRTAGYNDHIDKKDIDTDDMERLEALTLDEVMTEVSLYCHKQVIEALERVDKEVDNTVVFLTKDLPSLLNLDHDLKIRKVHKDEIHKIIQKEIAELRKTL